MEKLNLVDQNEIERVAQLRSQVIDVLKSVGIDSRKAKNIDLLQVDEYHRNVFFVIDPEAPNQEPLYVVKSLDKNVAWDVVENSVRREHDIAYYASTVVPELIPRTVAAWVAKTDMNPAVVLYNYLGEAASPMMDSNQIKKIAQESMVLLQKIHLNTLSRNYGVSLDDEKRVLERYPAGLGSEKVRYLLNDIKRDNLDPTGIIHKIISKKWIPLLDAQKIFCLTHKDITLSNILIKDGRVRTFIDWTHSRWDDPAYDIAYLAFWSVKLQGQGGIVSAISLAEPRYANSGFDIASTFPFYLAFKCIEYGRFKGRKWVDLGAKILETDSMTESLDLMKNCVSKLDIE